MRELLVGGGGGGGGDGRHSFVDSYNSKHSIALHRLDTTAKSYSTASVSSLLTTAGGEL